MGAIELQVFVSLVVILGAAFVALICDFLKGNNEQLRESNIEMRVRQHEREKREEILDKVQRQTIETLVQARVAPVPVAAPAPRPAVAPVAAPVQAQQTRPSAAEAPDTRESFERAQQERSARRREGRRQHPPPSAVATPAIVETGQVHSWAQSIVLKKHPHPVEAIVAPVEAAVAPVEAIVAPVEAIVALVETIVAPVEAIVALVEATVAPVEATVAPVEESAPPVAGVQPVSVRLAVVTSQVVHPSIAAIPAQLPVQAESPVLTLTAGAAAGLRQIETQAGLPLALVPGQAQASQLFPASLTLPSELLLPRAGVSVERPEFDIVEPVAPVAEVAPEVVPEVAPEIISEVAPEAQLPEIDSPVVRIRVLSDSDVLPMDEPLELALPVSEAELFDPLESLVPAPQAMAIAPILADESLEPALPVAEIETAIIAEPFELALPVAEIETPVVAEPFELDRPVAEIETPIIAEPFELALPVAEIETAVVAEPLELALPVAEIETVFAAEPLELILPDTKPVPALMLEPLESAVASFESAEAIPEPILPIDSEIHPLFTPHVEIRSNVVEMPATPVVRNLEPERPVQADLIVPGGYHEAPALARLLEEDAPFNGLAIVISVLDYVRLMADQGKPAAEQLMGAISRLVMSLAREQDFACRIAEDEFVLLFARETGAAAKRRIQLVSERLWDFQLRSLGSVSVIFSWGAAESTKDAVVHAVEYAREQMLESRRNRRALASGVGRFRRRAANS